MHIIIYSCWQRAHSLSIVGKLSALRSVHYRRFHCITANIFLRNTIFPVFVPESFRLYGDGECEELLLTLARVIVVVLCVCLSVCYR